MVMLSGLVELLLLAIVIALVVSWSVISMWVVCSLFTALFILCCFYLFGDL